MIGFQTILLYLVGIFIASVFLGLLTGPWWYRKTLVGGQFFMTKKTKPNVYGVWMVPSFFMIRESLKNKSKGRMFFGKLDIMLDDLSQYPPDSEFFMITHQKLLSWLENKDQLIVSKPEYIDKRFLAVRTFMILNKTGPLWERVPFYRVNFKFK